jgi:hypothetical protein
MKGIAPAVILCADPVCHADLYPVGSDHPWFVPEHRIISRRCSCGMVTAGKGPPPGMAAPVQYGPRVSAAHVFVGPGRVQLGQHRADHRAT